MQRFIGLDRPLQRVLVGSTRTLSALATCAHQNPANVGQPAAEARWSARLQRAGGLMGVL